MFCFVGSGYENPNGLCSVILHNNKKIVLKCDEPEVRPSIYIYMNHTYRCQYANATYGHRYRVQMKP